jgi:hypothetical protein
MTPRLPPELLSHILDLAQEDEDLLEHQQLRNAFRRVCRDWCLCMNYWRQLAVNGSGQVECLTKLLIGADGAAGGSTPGQAVETVFVSLPDRRGRNKAAKLCALLDAAPNLKHVGLEIGHNGLVRKGLLGLAVAEALAELKNITDFRLTQLGSKNRPTQPIPAKHLHL